MEQNPYQAPAANVDTLLEGEIANAEEIRKQYINHEASIRSVGLLYYLGFIGSLVALVVYATEFNRSEMGVSIAIIAVFAVLAALYLWVGRGLRTLKSSIKIPATIIAALGLLSFPVGTLINGYILYLIHSAKGKMVFSEEYSKVIAATPHIKYKTPLLVWIFLGIIVLGIGAAIVIPMVA